MMRAHQALIMVRAQRRNNITKDWDQTIKPSEDINPIVVPEDCKEVSIKVITGNYTKRGLECSRKLLIGSMFDSEKVLLN